MPRHPTSRKTFRSCSNMSGWQFLLNRWAKWTEEWARKDHLHLTSHCPSYLPIITRLITREKKFRIGAILLMLRKGRWCTWEISKAQLSTNSRIYFMDSPPNNAILLNYNSRYSHSDLRCKWIKCWMRTNVGKSPRKSKTTAGLSKFHSYHYNSLLSIPNSNVLLFHKLTII